MAKKRSTRNWLPCRVCGSDHTNPQSSGICPACGAAASAAAAAEAAARAEEEDRYMPTEYKLEKRLAELTGYDAARLVAELTEALIYEAQRDKSDG